MLAPEPLECEAVLPKRIDAVENVQTSLLMACSRFVVLSSSSLEFIKNFASVKSS